MKNNSDRELIKHFLDWLYFHRFTLAEGGRLVGRSRAWASNLSENPPTTLRNDVKVRIRFLIGQ